MNNDTIKAFNPINKKVVDIIFDCCECGGKIQVNTNIPKPNPDGENFTNGMEINDVEKKCSACKKSYQIQVQVDQHGTSGAIYITPSVNETSLKIL